MLSPYSYICIFCILKRPWIFLYLAISCVLLHPKVSVCNSCVHIVVCMYIIVPLHPVSFSIVLYELFTAFPLTYSSLTLVFCISCICCCCFFSYYCMSLSSIIFIPVYLLSPTVLLSPCVSLSFHINVCLCISCNRFSSLSISF